MTYCPCLPLVNGAFHKITAAARVVAVATLLAFFSRALVPLPLTQNRTALPRRVHSRMRNSTPPPMFAR